MNAAVQRKKIRSLQKVISIHLPRRLRTGLNCVGRSVGSCVGGDGQGGAGGGCDIEKATSGPCWGRPFCPGIENFRVSSKTHFVQDRGNGERALTGMKALDGDGRGECTSRIPLGKGEK